MGNRESGIGNREWGRRDNGSYDLPSITGDYNLDKYAQICPSATLVYRVTIGDVIQMVAGH